ncbi:META domain-containing protein [Neisseria sp. 83E34]|uniref:META domain-containing protein n=1 Tax=Neisseria sp. 83E34 TaxID=1692264 RepID=UPI0006CE7374|nr:META domain-containing protein [Neisseria sp. 83E34]
MKLPFIASTLLLLAACTVTPQQSGSAAPPQSSTHVKRIWKLIEMEGFSRDQLINAKATMDWTKLPKIHAYMGCNQLIFSAEKMNAGQISFSNAAATRMYCAETMKLEQTFLSKLNSIHSYTVQGHELILNSPKGKSMRFIAEDWD